MEIKWLFIIEDDCNMNCNMDCMDCNMDCNMDCMDCNMNCNMDCMDCNMDCMDCNMNATGHLMYWQTWIFQVISPIFP